MRDRIRTVAEPLGEVAVERAAAAARRIVAARHGCARQRSLLVLAIAMGGRRTRRQDNDLLLPDASARHFDAFVASGVMSGER